MKVSYLLKDAQFLLSFRRELMMWFKQITNNQHKHNQLNFNYIELLSILNELYLDTKYNRTVLYHTHIRYLKSTFIQYFIQKQTMLIICIYLLLC